jgi:hypothetical protein
VNHPWFLDFVVCKSELLLRCNDDVRSNLRPRQIFLRATGAKYRGKALISRRAELVVSSSPSRFQVCGGRPPKISYHSAASIGSNHTIAELTQCSLINCWSHVQNVTPGPWPSMRGKGDGRRKRLWSGLPAPNVVIRRKNALVPLRKERACSTKIAVAVSRLHCLRSTPEDFPRGTVEPMRRVKLSWISSLIGLPPTVATASSTIPVIAGPIIAG